MKSCFVALLLSLTACTAVAQWSGPAWNPRCYYPQVGNRTEIDTIFGNDQRHPIGDGLRNIGPRPGESYGTIAPVFLQGVGAGDLPVNYSFDAGLDFDLHHLKLNKRLPFHLDGEIVQIGHFRDTYHNDILTSHGGQDAQIYWEDDLGNYDSLRMSRFATRLSNGKLSTGTSDGMTFCAKITSDTVLDVVFSFGFGSGIGFYGDSLGISQAPGGEYLHAQSDTILAKSSCPLQCYYNTDKTTFQRYVTPGHPSNTKGILAEDGLGNLFYSSITKGMTLPDIARSLVYDTLLSIASIPNALPHTRAHYNWKYAFEMPVFPKQPGDSSTDLVDAVEFDGYEYWTLLFKGGPRFGQQRLTIDSAFVMHPPSDYGAQDFQGTPPEVIQDCGDMTGRGNHTLCVEYKTDPAYAAYCFYELGSQLDDKIDMFYVDGPMQGDWGAIDTITANKDNLQDLIIGEASRYNHGGFTDINGTIHIVYGTREVPTRAVKKTLGPTESGFSIYPNPVRGHLAVLEFDSEREQRVEISIHDLLGRSVARQNNAVTPGAQSIALHIPELPTGQYEVQVSGPDGSAFQKLIISH